MLPNGAAWHRRRTFRLAKSTGRVASTRRLVSYHCGFFEPMALLHLGVFQPCASLLKHLASMPIPSTSLLALDGERRLENGSKVTMRGAERPAQVQWTRPFLPILKPLSDEAAHQTFIDIADDIHIDDSDLRTILDLTNKMPLAVALIAHLFRRRRWLQRCPRSLGPRTNVPPLLRHRQEVQSGHVHSAIAQNLPPPSQTSTARHAGYTPRQCVVGRWGCITPALRAANERESCWPYAGSQTAKSTMRISGPSRKY
ncbi:hypothetical protein C8F01DRAFT_369886 [Mycena amicta]|nr:hypothetical protein C8F01DRAFT_369886 [Mycena amicta]